jgi:endonuclease-8
MTERGSAVERAHYAGRVPEGDSLHRAARRLQPLVGEVVEIETPHPRAQLTGIAERLGPRRRLEGVEAVGKNLLLRFEGGLVLRSHLRMTGRWLVRERGRPVLGRPWLVLRGERLEALQLNGPVLRVDGGAARRVGPDVLAAVPDVDAMLARLRAAEPSTFLGEALQRQRLVAGIGNMWMAEALWEARLSPWLRVGEASDAQLREALEAAVRLMWAALDGFRGTRRAYRRAGRPCPRCGEAIRSRGQGDANRTAYWCPRCQEGPGPPGE